MSEAVMCAHGRQLSLCAVCAPAAEAQMAAKRGRLEAEERFSPKLDEFQPTPQRFARITAAGRAYLQKLRLEGKAEPEGGKN